jgi:hypothetical protein
MPSPIRPLLTFVCLSLLVCTPTILAAASYFHYQATRPPTFPGDPDIGFGILMLVALANAPVLALTWLGWFVWRSLRKRKGAADDT